MTEHLRITVDNAIMRITLARPEKKNALTQAMYVAFGEALTRAEGDPAVRVVLIDSEGDSFTAGNDIADFAAIATGARSREQMQTHIFLEAIARGTKPYVAAVAGLAVGVGVTMLMHCDVSYVAEDARLSTPFVNLALVPEAASTLLIPARIGYARAFQLFALGEPIDGKTAAAMGLVTAAFPAAEVRTKALATARALAAKPAGALQATKKLMRDSAAILAVMAREGDAFGQRLRSPEAAEAFRAFAERRAPDFTKIQG